MHELSLRAVALAARQRSGRHAYDPYKHRVELYTRAAPVLRAFGYRQVTMKAIAHACGVSAPALYRYFPSKRDLVLFPLELPPQGYCATMMRHTAAQYADPLRGLRAALKLAINDIDLVVLALRLGIEAGQRPEDPFARHDLKSPTLALGDLLLQCVPALGDRAHDLAQTIVSIVIAAAATNEELPPGVLWRQGITVLRTYLVDAGVAPARFDEVFAS